MGCSKNVNLALTGENRFVLAHRDVVLNCHWKQEIRLRCTLQELVGFVTAGEMSFTSYILDGPQSPFLMRWLRETPNSMCEAKISSFFT